MNRCEYMEDCVHLKACRRLVKIFKTKECRGCNENCTAYEPESEKRYSRSQVQYAINRAAEDAINGYTDNLVEDYI